MFKPFGSASPDHASSLHRGAQRGGTGENQFQDMQSSIKGNKSAARWRPLTNKSSVQLSVASAECERLSKLAGSSDPKAASFLLPLYVSARCESSTAAAGTLGQLGRASLAAPAGPKRRAHFFKNPQEINTNFLLVWSLQHPSCPALHPSKAVANNATGIFCVGTPHYAQTIQGTQSLGTNFPKCWAFPVLLEVRIVDTWLLRPDFKKLHTHWSRISRCLAFNTFPRL